MPSPTTPAAAPATGGAEAAFTIESTPVLLKTIYIVKLPHSPMPYTATTTVFGYKKLADAQWQVESNASWFQPALEIWALHIRGQISMTGDERVAMAAGADVERIELRKRYKGGGL